jgi:hypothetical protein
MFTQAFVAAGCFGDPTFNDKRPLEHLKEGHWQRLDLMAAKVDQDIPARQEIPEEIFAEWFSQTLADAPEVIVWRRSVPHGNMGARACFRMVDAVLAFQYEVRLVVPWRIPCQTPKFVEQRGTWTYRRGGLRDIVDEAHLRDLDPFLVNYDAFVTSEDYRSFVNFALDLPLPDGFEKLKYVHAGTKWGDGKWMNVYSLEPLVN